MGLKTVITLDQKRYTEDGNNIRLKEMYILQPLTQHIVFLWILIRSPPKVLRSLGMLSARLKDHGHWRQTKLDFISELIIHGQTPSLVFTEFCASLLNWLTLNSKTTWPNLNLRQRANSQWPQCFLEGDTRWLPNFVPPSTTDELLCHSTSPQHPSILPS